MKLWIPDFSEHQGRIDWPKLKGKIPGVIIRIGYGDDLKSQDDVYAKYNLSEAKKLGIPYAVYIYSYARTEKQIKSEIAHTKRMCEGYAPVYFFLDLEEWSNKDFAMKAAKMWLAAFPKGGVYAGQSYWKGPLKGLVCDRWIPAYGKNSGKREDSYKPPYDMIAWQFTSRYSLAGVSGNVDMSEFYVPFGNAEITEVKQERRPVLKKEVALIIFRHLCTHQEHGYTQDMDKRWGTGTEEIDIYGHKYLIAGGDRDCSSAVISSFEAAGISCGGATYTGNMEECMIPTGNFRKRPMSFIAQESDVYLHKKNHTAMCISPEPDILGEFSGNEKGGATGGKTGDQLQKGEYDETHWRGESHLAPYYDYGKHGWDMILECTNNEIAFWIGDDEEGDAAVAENEAAVLSDLVGAKNATTTEDSSATANNNTRSEMAVYASKVILGDYGNSPGRRKKLGDKYDEVQKVVTNVLQNHRDELIDAMAAFIEKID